MSSLAIIIPWHKRPDHTGAWRERVWRYLRPLWESTGYDLIIGSDPLVSTQDFSVSRATNQAAARALDHVSAFALFGADHVPDMRVLEYCLEQLETHAWVRPHDHIAYASERDTRALTDSQITLAAVRWQPEPAPCPGVVVVRRDAFESVGGMDEGYEGWGWEDADFTTRLERRFGESAPQCEWFLKELWHHGDHRVGFDTPNHKRFYDEYYANNKAI